MSPALVRPVRPDHRRRLALRQSLLRPVRSLVRGSRPRLTREPDVLASNRWHETLLERGGHGGGEGSRVRRLVVLGRPGHDSRDEGNHEPDRDQPQQRLVQGDSPDGRERRCYGSREQPVPIPPNRALMLLVQTFELRPRRPTLSVLRRDPCVSHPRLHLLAITQDRPCATRRETTRRRRSWHRTSDGSARHRRRFEGLRSPHPRERRSGMFGVAGRAHGPRGMTG